MTDLEQRPTPPVRRDIELEQRPLYQMGSQREACTHSGEDEGEFSKQIDPERNKPESNLYRLIRELYGDSFADRKLRVEGRVSNIVSGKLAILLRYAESFTGCRRSSPRELRGLVDKLSETISDVMKRLPELSFSEQMEVSNRIVSAANDLVNAASAFRDGLRLNGIENSEDQRLQHSEHIS
ncbi:MAG: hypothetical protein DMF68_01520 [Acidobacteria bacterium]|nr:MAG: hypothetical protein DMF68_01520 [Acidobacteriota bacterium]